MESMSNARERIDALEQQRNGLGAHTRPGERRRRGWRLLWRGAAAPALALALPLPLHAKTFRCGAGDVPCLIAAINKANANGDTNTIRLEAGPHTLTAIDHDSDGPTGLPSITSPLTLRGAGSDTTIIERAASAPEFRLLHVAAEGSLTLTRLTLQGGAVHNAHA